MHNFLKILINSSIFPSTHVRSETNRCKSVGLGSAEPAKDLSHCAQAIDSTLARQGSLCGCCGRVKRQARESQNRLQVQHKPFGDMRIGGSLTMNMNGRGEWRLAFEVLGLP